MLSTEVRGYVRGGLALEYLGFLEENIPFPGGIDFLLCLPRVNYPICLGLFYPQRGFFFALRGIFV